jgi:hypothetical protein
LATFFFFALQVGEDKHLLRYSSLAGVGFLGGGGPLFAISALFIVPVIVWILADQLSLRSKILSSTSTMGGILLSLFVSLTSPGSTARRELIHEDLHVDYLEKLTEAIFGIPIAVGSWLLTVFSLFTLVAILGGMIVGLRFASTAKPEGRLDPLVLYTLFFLFASLVFFLVNSGLEKVVYEAWWHTMTARLFIFVSGTLFGFWLTLRLSLLAREQKKSRDSWVSRTATYLLVAAFLSVSAFGASSMVGSITDRHEKWNLGDAPLSAVGDISSDWVLDAAKRVTNPYWKINIDRLGVGDEGPQR